LKSVANSSWNDDYVAFGDRGRDFGGVGFAAEAFGCLVRRVWRSAQAGKERGKRKRRRGERRGPCTKFSTPRRYTEDFMGCAMEVGGAIHCVSLLWGYDPDGLEVGFDA
jgi:hypothetical protein